MKTKGKVLYTAYVRFPYNVSLYTTVCNRLYMYTGVRKMHYTCVRTGT